jgi:hypothetical protein
MLHRDVLKKRAVYRAIFNNIVKDGAKGVFIWANSGNNVIPDEVATIRFEDTLMEEVRRRFYFDLNDHFQKLFSDCDKQLDALDRLLFSLRASVPDLSHYVVLGVKLVLADSLVLSDCVTNYLNDVLEIRCLGEVMEQMDRACLINRMFKSFSDRISTAENFLNSISSISSANSNSAVVDVSLSNTQLAAVIGRVVSSTSTAVPLM